MQHHSTPQAFCSYAPPTPPTHRFGDIPPPHPTRSRACLPALYSTLTPSFSPPTPRPPTAEYTHKHVRPRGRRGGSSPAASSCGKGADSPANLLRVILHRAYPTGMAHLLTLTPNQLRTEWHNLSYESAEAGHRLGRVRGYERVCVHVHMASPGCFERGNSHLHLPHTHREWRHALRYAGKWPRSC